MNDAITRGVEHAEFVVKTFKAVFFDAGIEIELVAAELGGGFAGDAVIHKSRRKQQFGFFHSAAYGIGKLYFFSLHLIFGNIAPKSKLKRFADLLEVGLEILNQSPEFLIVAGLCHVRQLVNDEVAATPLRHIFDGIAGKRDDP